MVIRVQTSLTTFFERSGFRNQFFLSEGHFREKADSGLKLFLWIGGEVKMVGIK